MHEESFKLHTNAICAGVSLSKTSVSMGFLWEHLNPITAKAIIMIFTSRIIKILQLFLLKSALTHVFATSGRKKKV